MADNTSTILTGIFSVGGTLGSIYLKDYLDRRRAGLIGGGTAATPQPVQTSAAAPAPIAQAPSSSDAPAPQISVPPQPAAAQAASPTAPSVAPDQYPEREDYSSRFMFMLARYKKSLIIAATGLILGWLGAEDYAAVTTNSDGDIGATAAIMTALVFYIGPVVLFILEKRYLSKWDYSGYVVNCATLFTSFGVGLSLNIDVATGIGMVIGVLIVGLLPSAALGFLAGKLFYKPKAI